MAVQARHLNPFPPSLLPDNNVYGKDEAGNTSEVNACSMFSGGKMRFDGLSTNTVLDSNLLAQNVYQNNGLNVLNAPRLPTWNPPLKAESGITYVDSWCLPLASRKRCRDYVGDAQIGYATTTSPGGYCPTPKYAILGEDLSYQIQIHNLDVDRIISQHMEKVRMYIEEKSKCEMRKWAAGVEQQLAKRLRSREEEIDRIGKLNWALEERIKSLSMESQIWKDLACANEATANALRRNLEEVLSHTGREEAGAASDVESSCGSTVGDAGDEVTAARVAERWQCRGCGKEEARVLALPCRHLCMCAACGSSTHVCPVCRSPKNASVVVNFA